MIEDLHAMASRMERAELLRHVDEIRQAEHMTSVRNAPSRQSWFGRVIHRATSLYAIGESRRDATTTHSPIVADSAALTEGLRQVAGRLSFVDAPAQPSQPLPQTEPRVPSPSLSATANSVSANTLSANTGAGVVRRRPNRHGNGTRHHRAHHKAAAVHKSGHPRHK
jgi:hypothetical protein